MISHQQFISAARQLGCEVNVLKSVCHTNGNGRSFRPDGKCRISFEGQLFWKELLKEGIDPNQHLPGNEDILYPVWNAVHSNSLRMQNQYSLLNKARQISEEAALKATCWGAFQLAGTNYSLCGYTTVKDFVVSQHYEESQLMAFCKYLENSLLDINLRNHDWRGFASGFNGSDYHRPHMAIKLRKAYNQLNTYSFIPDREPVFS